jgi:hypothetical protein
MVTVRVRVKGCAVDETVKSGDLEYATVDEGTAAFSKAIKSPVVIWAEMETEKALLRYKVKGVR